MSDNYLSDPRAKSIEGFIAALQIIAKHKPKGLSEKYFCGAEHEVLYIYDCGESIPPGSDDGNALESLGFHFDGDAETWAYFT